jgi:FkbM family methyltransferase
MISRLRNRMLTSLSGKGINRFLRSSLSIDVTRHADLLKDLQRLLGPNPALILDVGANVGQSAQVYSQMFPTATIYSFEPFAQSYEQLVNKRIARVKSIQAAVGAQTGRATLQVNADSRANSLLPSNAEGRQVFPEKLAKVSEVEVDVIALDNLRAQEALTYVDFLKIDVQGSELAVLAGATELLLNVGIVQAECNFVPQYQGSSTFSDVDIRLRAAGFFLYNVYHLYQDPSTRRTIYCLGLFLNSRRYDHLHLQHVATPCGAGR